MPSEDYDIPLPSKMKLKETKAEAAEKIYRREQRRQEKEARRIARANGGYARSPVRADGSVSPPRYGPRAGHRHDPEAEELLDREEWADKMAFMEAEELGHHDPFGAFGMGFGGFMPGGFFGQRIPPRYRHDMPGPSRRRDAAQEVRFEGGPAPYAGDMTEEEYAAFVRDGMNRLKHRREMEDLERRRAAVREKQRQEERERFIAEERDRKKSAKKKEERGRVQEEGKRDERKRWRDRCAALMDGEIVSLDLKFSDIPWPVYTATGSEGVSVVLTPDDITIESVRVFLHGIADDEAKAKDTKSITDARRKILREAMRLFHPDKFLRVLPRVREQDKTSVKEAAERLSRLLNDLMSQK